MSDTETRAWWTTSIIDMEPGRIAFRGEKVEDLIGNSSFAEMIWFMVVGTKPSPGQQRCWMQRWSLVLITAPKRPQLPPRGWRQRAGLA